MTALLLAAFLSLGPSARYGSATTQPPADLGGVTQPIARWKPDPTQPNDELAINAGVHFQDIDTRTIPYALLKISLVHRTAQRLYWGGYLGFGINSQTCEHAIGEKCQRDSYKFSGGPQLKYAFDSLGNLNPWFTLGLGYSYLTYTVDDTTKVGPLTGEVDLQIQPGEGSYAHQEWDFSGIEVPAQFIFDFRFSNDLRLGLYAQLVPVVFLDSGYCAGSCASRAPANTDFGIGYGAGLVVTIPVIRLE